MNKKVKLGLEILLTVVILGMIYKLATDEDTQGKAQDTMTERALMQSGINPADLSAIGGMGGNGGEPAPVPQMKDMEAISNQIMRQEQSTRGDFSDLNQ